MNNNADDEIEKMLLEMVDVLDEVREKKEDGKTQEAIQLLDELVKVIEETIKTGKLFVNDDKKEYFSFSEPCEEMLYKNYFNPKKEIINIDMPFSDIYMEQGNLYLQINKFSDAEVAFSKAMKWNPANADIILGYSEAYKKSNNLQQFYELSKLAFHYAVNKVTVAASFKNMGYYLSKIEEYPAALGCYLMGMQFNRFDEDIKKHMSDMRSELSAEINAPEQKEMQTYAQKYGFPMGADPMVIAMCYETAQKYQKENKRDEAIYYYHIVYELTGDEEARKYTE